MSELTKDKQRTVNGAVRFLKTGLDQREFITNRRAYKFFTDLLSMPAMTNIGTFADHHFANSQTKSDFLATVRDEIRRRITLDSKRNSDVAALFIPDGYGFKPGPYAHLLQDNTERDK